MHILDVSCISWMCLMHNLDVYHDFLLFILVGLV